jgi:hypothetical protein
MERILRSPLFWAIAIVGTLVCFYKEPDTKAVEGTYTPYPYTNRARKQDSMAQQRAIKGSGSHRTHTRSTTLKLYEVQVYENGKWRTVDQIKIRNFPQPEERDVDEVWDELEGR